MLDLFFKGRCNSPYPTLSSVKGYVPFPVLVRSLPDRIPRTANPFTQRNLNTVEFLGQQYDHQVKAPRSENSSINTINVQHPSHQHLEIPFTRRASDYISRTIEETTQDSNKNGNAPFPSQQLTAKRQAQPIHKLYTAGNTLQKYTISQNLEKNRYSSKIIEQKGEEPLQSTNRQFLD